MVILNADTIGDFTRPLPRRFGYKIDACAIIVYGKYDDAGLDEKSIKLNLTLPLGHISKGILLWDLTTVRSKVHFDRAISNNPETYYRSQLRRSLNPHISILAGVINVSFGLTHDQTNKVKKGF